MLKNPKPAMIEAMEQRLLFAASALTESIDVSTLPTSISDQTVLKGTLAMTVSNTSGLDEKETGSLVDFVISSTPLDPPTLNFYILKQLKTNLSLPNGASKSFKFAINVNLAKGRPPDGVYTIYALIIDSGSNHSQSVPGPTLTVHPPNIILSETENLLKVPDSTTTGSKFHVTDEVTITNSGTDPSSTPLKIGIYLTPDGIPADGSLMTGVTKKVVVGAGKTVKVPVTIAAIPALAVGTYEFITQVTQSNGTVTTTDPTTAPTITLNKPTTGPQFSDSFIGAPTKTYTFEPLDGALEYLSTLKFEMSIKNTGSTANGNDVFTLFASPDPTFDSSALQVGQVTLNLNTPHNGLRTFFVAWNLTTDLENYSVQDIRDYIFVQITDPTGNVTTARYPTTLLVGGTADVVAIG
jgi:hypothetical protein